MPAALHACRPLGRSVLGVVLVLVVHLRGDGVVVVLVGLLPDEEKEADNAGHHREPQYTARCDLLLRAHNDLLVGFGLPY